MRSIPNAVIILLALLFAAAGSFLIVNFLQEQQRKGIVPGQVVIAKQDLPPQHAIGVDMIETKSLPIAEVPPNSLNTLQQAVGKVTRVAIPAGQIISAKDVLSESENLIGFLPPNRRAMTISVRQIPGEANLYRVGQVVDILVTLGAEGGRLKAKTILQNIRILAKHPVRLEESQGATDVSYTFGVSPEEAETLALVQREGNLQIVMRGQSDTETVTTPGASTDQIFGRVAGALQELQGKPSAAEQAPAPSGPTMEVIRGTQLEVKQFGELPAPVEAAAVPGAPEGEGQLEQPTVAGESPPAGQPAENENTEGAKQEEGATHETAY